MMNVALGAISWMGRGGLVLAAEDLRGPSVFQHFVVAGGWITWCLLIPLSMATVALTIQYLITIRRATQMPISLAKALVAAARQGQRRNILETTRDSDTMLGQAAYAAALHTADGMDAAMAGVDEAVEDRVGRLMRRVEYLSVIGNVSPMIGLLGTVVGMIQAFNRIYTAGGGVPETSKLVGDIAIALVNTFWGLAIAIPALTMYAFFRNRVDAFASDCIRLSGGLAASLVDAERTAGAAPATART
ncbi:MAG: MotA/TolQ/ExbB proton channel family protein [Planctomycetes bacterium]|nr:MotA/TolQ/ExbB proton channel family protein [Planctomycetota bacterium]